MKNNLNIPVPQGKYLPAIRHSNIIYTSGMTPREGGKLIFTGKIEKQKPVESYKEAIELATLNALIAAQGCLDEGENILLILHLQVYLNTEEGFTAHPQLADFASQVLMDKLGSVCMGSRAAIGVASLPSNAPVEITLTALVG